MSWQSTQKSILSRVFFPDWPILIWMILTALLIGLLSGMSATEIVRTFNKGWGYAAGEFALILLPSLVIAAVIEHQDIDVSPTISVLMAPIAGAGMICPDTAYAALSPMVRRRKLLLAFGAFSGFKLLFPAGPLIIATGLGIDDTRILIYSLLIFVPVWITGLVYGKIIGDRVSPDLNAKDQLSPPFSLSSLVLLWPFALLIVLLALGMSLDTSTNVWLDFATNPKGALLITAAASLFMIPHQDRRTCIDTGIRRTGSLLLLIGAASAFSAFVTSLVPIETLFAPKDNVLTLLSLFLISALFKLLQGSSMATFAAVGPVAAPIVSSADISSAAAVIAICLGSFVAILPNDSFYWLVRKSALPNLSETYATIVLGCGAVLQAMVGLVFLISLYLNNLI